MRRHSTEDVRLDVALVRRHAGSCLAAWLLCAGLSYPVCGASPHLLKGIILAAFLVPVALLDVWYGLIFDRLLLPMALIGILLTGARPGIDFLLSVAAGSLPLFFLRRATRGGVGGGDVKLMAALGCWLPWADVLLTLFLAFVSGGIMAAALLAAGRKPRDEIAFGPFLAGGAWTVFLFGEALWGWYKGFFYG